MIPQATPTPTKATPPRCTAFGAALVLGLLKLLIRAHLRQQILCFRGIDGQVG